MKNAFRVVVIGVSAGGIEALRSLLGGLPGDFPLPIAIVQHLCADSEGTLAQLLDSSCALCVMEAEEGDVLKAGRVYLAPANYHLLLEANGTVALSVDPPVRYARPSADVLFESAAHAFGAGVIGIVLTGANDDGTFGVQQIKACGGVALVQDPDEASVDQMPRNAMQHTLVDLVLPLAGLVTWLKCCGADTNRSGEKGEPDG